MAPDASRLPNLAHYTDHLTFLRDWLEAKKSARKSFSLRSFAQRATGLSPAFLTLVLSGQRQLSMESGARVARAMDLDMNEETYFLALLGLALARSAQDRDDALRHVRTAKASLASRELPTEVSTVLRESWLASVITALVEIPGFKPTGEWIADKLQHVVAAETAQSCVDEMIVKGMLVETDGVYAFKSSDVSTDSTRALSVVIAASPQRKPIGTLRVLEAWLKILPLSDPDSRVLSTTYMPVAATLLPEIRKRILALRDEIKALNRESRDPPDLVVNLGLYLVPITRGNEPR